jgi:hypothetical protein
MPCPCEKAKIYENHQKLPKKLKESDARLSAAFSIFDNAKTFANR